MNPVIIIPTYWCDKEYTPSLDLFGVYDHMTPITKEGELPRCLKSLVGVKGICRIMIPVVTEGVSSEKACEHVREIASQFGELETMVIGDAEIARIHARLDELGHPEFKEALSNVGYGSVRNLGLAIAAILGHTEVVFIDDDEVISDKNFLITAMYGLGKVTKRGIPILCKTGYFLDRSGSFLAGGKDPWYNMRFKQVSAFNEWMEQAMREPRLKPSNTCYGGCMALHSEAYRRVAFDPWITRGEDLDYLINLRMHGLDVWFDRTFSLRHYPPQSTSEPLRFRQDIYRWIYEQRKIEYLKSQIDLIQIRPRDLDPYPGPFIDASIGRRLAVTARLRGIAKRERDYAKTASSARKDAERYAQEHCSQYFRFQMVWPQIIELLAGDEPLATFITQGRERRHSGYTDQFSAVSPEEEWDRETGSSEVEAIAKRWAKGSGRRRSRAAGPAGRARRR